MLIKFKVLTNAVNRQQKKTVLKELELNSKKLDRIEQMFIDGGKEDLDAFDSLWKQTVGRLKMKHAVANPNYLIEKYAK